MDERRWQQLAATSGLGFVVLALIGTLVTGSPPAQHASPDSVVSYIADKRTAILVSYALWTAAAVAFIWFFSALRTFLTETADGTYGERLGTTAFGGALATVAIGITGGLPLLAVAYRGLHTLDANLVKLVYDTNLAVNAVVVGPIIVAIAATSLAIMRGAGLPRWIGELGFAVAAFNVLGLTALFFDTGAMAVGGGVQMSTGFVSFAWMAITSVAMTLHYSPSHVTSTRPAAHPA